MTDETHRTITLTDRPPVRIVVADWPVIASAKWSDHDNQYEFQANRKWSASLTVRQHADGRTIVYGRSDFDSVIPRDRSWVTKAGELLPAGADTAGIVKDIKLVYASMRRHENEPNLAAQCIADLPAESI